MVSEIDTWFAENLFGPQEWYPERMGRKHIIYSRTSGATLVSMAIDPASDLPGWQKLPEKSYTESLFALLAPLVKVGAEIVYLTYPDGAWIEMHGLKNVDTVSWNPWLLRFFEETPGEQGGGQMLVVLLSGRRAALVFERFDSFEITFYGSDDLWQNISNALQGSGLSEAPPGMCPA